MLINIDINPASMIAADKSQTERACHALIASYQLDMVIVTCGTNGSYVINKDTCSFVATPKVEVADTVGAGDSFTATFIAKLLQGASIEEAHQLAVQVSAYVCTQSGAMPSLPEEFIK